MTLRKSKTSRYARRFSEFRVEARETVEVAARGAVVAREVARLAEEVEDVLLGRGGFPGGFRLGEALERRLAEVAGLRVAVALEVAEAEVDERDDRVACGRRASRASRTTRARARGPRAPGRARSGCSRGCPGRSRATWARRARPPSRWRSKVREIEAAAVEAAASSNRLSAARMLPAWLLGGSGEERVVAERLRRGARAGVVVRGAVRSSGGSRRCAPRCTRRGTTCRGRACGGART